MEEGSIIPFSLIDMLFLYLDWYIYNIHVSSKMKVNEFWYYLCRVVIGGNNSYTCTSIIYFVYFGTEDRNTQSLIIQVLDI